MNQIINWQVNFINQLLENFKKGKFIHYLEIIFGMLIQLICKSLSKQNKGVKYLLCVIDLFSKYAWVAPIKDKKGTSMVNAFKKIISKKKKTK